MTSRKMMPVWHGLTLENRDGSYIVAFGDPLAFIFRYDESGNLVELPKESWVYDYCSIEYRIYFKDPVSGKLINDGLWCDNLLSVVEELRNLDFDIPDIYIRGHLGEALENYYKHKES